MSWVDSLKQVGFHAKAAASTAANNAVKHVTNAVQHVNEAKQNYQAWKVEKTAEHQQLKVQRQEANDRVAALKNSSMFPGMSLQQRSAEIKQVTRDMPGTTQVLHAHPVGKAITSPFRFLGAAAVGTVGLWKKILGVGRKGVAIAQRVTPGSNTLLLLAAIFYHLLIIASQPSLGTRIFYNALMILFIVIFIYDPSERNGDNYRTLLFLALFFEILLPYAVSTFSFLRNLTVMNIVISNYIANSFIVLTWIYYAVFGRGKDITTGPTKWLRVIIVIFLVFVLISFLGISQATWNDIELDTSSSSAWFAAQQVVSKSLEGFKLLKDTFVSAISSIQTIWSMRVKQATGEYYFGVVEENEKEKLGVYLENLKPSQSEYEEGEPVTVYASLLAKTLDDSVTVKVGCYAGNEKNKIMGTVYPSETFQISNLQQEELDCTFKQLPKGTHTVTYTADFNFETIGYLKRYFADRDSIAAATRQDIDLLDEYQVLDKNPVAHYTNGPVVMGIGPEQVLVGVSSDYAVKPRLAFTLDSKGGWGGTISELHQVVMMIPEEMSLDTTQCTDTNWKEYTVDDCVQSSLRYSNKISQDCNDVESCIQDECTNQLASYHAYSLNINNNPYYTNIQDYITLSCRLNVNDVMGLLEATPIATHYFYVQARYDYETTEDTSVTVVEGEGSSSSSQTVTPPASIPTFTSKQSEDELQFIFFAYGDSLFKAQDQFNVNACTLAAIIAQTSSGDPNYYHENGQKGLMAITDSLSQQYATAAGLSTYSLFEVDSNIKLGASMYASLSSDDKEKLKEYYTKINSLSSADQNAELFSVLTSNYIQDCTDLGLDKSRKATETGIETAYHTGAYPSAATTLASPVTLFTSGTQSFGLSAQESVDPVISEYDLATYSLKVHSYSNGQDLDDTLKQPLEWTGFDRNPLMQVYYSPSVSILSYRYFTDFVEDTSYLTEDRDVALIDNVLYVEYTGSEIVLKLANSLTDPTDLTQICDVPWSEHVAMQTCASAGITDGDENLPGLIIRNIETNQDTLGTGNVRIQLDWSNSRQLEATS